MPDALIYTTHATPIGTLLLIASNRGLRSVSVVESQTDVDAKLAQLAHGATQVVEAQGFLATACEAIDTYLRDGAALNLPYDLSAAGTPLQRAVWLAIARIPYGETISYTTLAARVGFPRAIRAVASACGANPVPLAIPCHRVIAKDGTLGGFSLGGGLSVKARLLALEGIKTAHEEAA